MEKSFRCTPSRTIQPLRWWLAALADSLSVQVAKVIGDTLYVLDAETTRRKIRLARIDGPERGQPFGARSNHYLLESSGLPQWLANVLDQS